LEAKIRAKVRGRKQKNVFAGMEKHDPRQIVATNLAQRIESGRQDEKKEVEKPKQKRSSPSFYEHNIG